MAQVKLRDQFGNYSRVVFDGVEDDAREYIVDHFPRLHVEPGSTAQPEPDAVLDVDGNESHWNGVRWSDDEPDANKDDKTTAPASGGGKDTNPPPSTPGKAN